MIHLPASVRVYLCLTACDMRKSFDGLHALVREHLEHTGSPRAAAILDAWEQFRPLFHKVVPHTAPAALATAPESASAAAPAERAP